MDTAEKVLGILAQIAETPEVRDQLDMRLYDLQVLDSLRTVELLLALSKEFDVELSPAGFDRDDWATPRKIVAFMRDVVGS